MNRKIEMLALDFDPIIGCYDTHVGLRVSSGKLSQPRDKPKGCERDSRRYPQRVIRTNQLINRAIDQREGVVGRAIEGLTRMG